MESNENSKSTMDYMINAVNVKGSTGNSPGIFIDNCHLYNLGRMNLGGVLYLD